MLCATKMRMAPIRRLSRICPKKCTSPVADCSVIVECARLVQAPGGKGMVKPSMVTASWYNGPKSAAARPDSLGDFAGPAVTMVSVAVCGVADGVTVGATAPLGLDFSVSFAAVTVGGG